MSIVHFLQWPLFATAASAMLLVLCCVGIMNGGHAVFAVCVSIAARLVLRTFISCFLLYVRNNSVTKYEYKVANATDFSMSGYFVELCKLLFFFLNNHCQLGIKQIKGQSAHTLRRV